jgi:CRP/FNR family nitrogen fixation transcriptional regulator
MQTQGNFTTESNWDALEGPARLPAFGAPMPAAFHPAGSEIFAPGSEVSSFYIVKFGCVRVYRLLADGRRQISAFHLPGEVFGFESDHQHHFFAEAVGATSTLSLRVSAAAELAGTLLPLALRGLVRAQEHLLVLGRQNAPERVAAFLLDMFERQGGLERVELPMSRTDIADYLGLSLETVSRVFTKLRGRGIIRLLSLRTVEIVKMQALSEMCE